VGLRAFEEMQPEYNLLAGRGTQEGRAQGWWECTLGTVVWASALCTVLAHRPVSEWRHECAHKSCGLSCAVQTVVALEGRCMPAPTPSWPRCCARHASAVDPRSHRPAGLLKPHVDLLLCETLATITEGVAAGSAAAASGLPWWISWTLEDSQAARLRSGERLQASRAGGWGW